MNRKSSSGSCRVRCGLIFLAPFAFGLTLFSQSQVPVMSPDRETRQPWQRSDERFIRGPWLVLAEIPVATGRDALGTDPFSQSGGEAFLVPADGMTTVTDDGISVDWRTVTAWGDDVDLSDGKGLKRDLVTYAATMINRDSAGPALLCLGSDEGMRAWVNGTLVLDRPGPRPLTFDEDRVEVDLNAGENLLLLKVEQTTGPWTFAARVLESGAIAPRVKEIGPSFTVEAPMTLVIKTDVNRDHANEAEVRVQGVAAGGKVLAEQSADRGEIIEFDATDWPDGAYELRFVTDRSDGLQTAIYREWYKGDAMEAARGLVAESEAADVNTPEGQTIAMLAEMVVDRLEPDGLSTTGNPWWAIHSPLMEYEELRLEAAGNETARIRGGGFVRLAWRDEVDGSPQFARAYLPTDYDPARKTPLILRLHGFFPENPEYLDWWSADLRHLMADDEYGTGEGIIYLEPHGRGNTQYLGIGDRDVMRAIAEARKHFNVDDDRVYLTGDSMGGWGVWNVGSRHPDKFAALAPIHGGVDYHAVLSPDVVRALGSLERMVWERDSSMAMADNLVNMPIMILHGDGDASVDVGFSRYNVRMLQRWGYDVRYVEFPGYGHENLDFWPELFDWFLEHRRHSDPRQVRVRSFQLEYASAYWVAVDSFERPDRFMVVDAEIVDINTVRLDSENVRTFTLTPGGMLIDPADPVRVVWNGVGRELDMVDGRIELRDVDQASGALSKNANVSGPVADFFKLPFAIVTGTSSADPSMNEVCRRKTDELIAWWQDYQHQTPRVYLDTGVSDEDAARYSLLLVGGPEANSVARRMGDALPLDLSESAIVIGERTFAVTDGWVGMIRPSPLNPDRSLLIVAATSAAGLKLLPAAEIDEIPFDFIIEDRPRTAGDWPGQPNFEFAFAGWFGRDWAFDESFVYEGNHEARASSVVLE